MTKTDHTHLPMQKYLLNKKSAATCLLASAIALMSLPCLAWNPFQSDDPDTKEKAAVVEFNWQLPAPPANENLLPFYFSNTTHQSFAIDTNSLTVDADAVIRYTMIASSASGAKNISYEGLRCGSFEKRIYALGHADGTWTRARDSDWQPIATKATNLQHAELAQYYFCKDGLIAGKAEQILQTMRYHKNGLAQP